MQGGAPPVIGWFITPSKYNLKYHTVIHYCYYGNKSTYNWGTILYPSPNLANHRGRGDLRNAIASYAKSLDIFSEKSSEACGNLDGVLGVLRFKANKRRWCPVINW